MTTDDIIKMAKEYADEVTNGYGVVTYEFDLYGLEKFALLIRAAERERIIAANAPEIEKVNVYIKTLEDAVADEREACAKAQPDLSQVGEVGVWGERQWQGLTDEEVKAAWLQLWYDLGNGKFAASDDLTRHTTIMFAKEIEAKLKEKNT